MNDSEVQSVLLEVLSALDAPCCLLSLSRDVVLTNRDLQDLLGLTPGGEISLVDFWPGFHVRFLDQKELLAQFLRVDGSLVSVGVVIHPISDDLFLLKISDTEQDQRQQFHSQRLETLGVLAGGVAHDFNNVLAGILGHITYLKTILAKEGSHSESLKAIEDGAKKASGLTRQILDFSRLDTSERPERIDLCELTRATCRLLKGATSSRCQIEVNTPAKPITIYGVEGKIAQIIVNLVVNARDAVSSNGIIRVETEQIENTEELQRLFGSDELATTRSALIRVSDDGHGMSPEILEKIFEPYFSTKKSLGNGLGLPMVQTIVQELGGVIDVESEEEVGTIVSVYLPLVESRTPDDDSYVEDEPESVLERGDERILIVDDEAPVRNVLAMSLEHLGYRVTTAASGSEALEYFRSVGGGVDLVILDMLMPQMPGEEVFRQLKELKSDVNVLVISGYSSAELVQEILDNGGRGFIQKPFAIDELSRKVRESLV